MTITRLRVAAAVLGTAGALVAAVPAAAMSGGQAVTDPDTARWVATLALRGDGGLLQRAGCGGALIAPDRVLTAAHCLDGMDPSRQEVHVDARTLSKDPGEVRGIRGVSVLPGYRIIPSPANPDDPNDASAANDLAVVLLDRPVTDVAPLPVARHRPAAGTAVSFFAHGTTGHTPDWRDDVLHRGELTTLDAGACTAGTPATVDTASVLCARDSNGSGDATVTGCFQDSGSPLVQGDALVGVFSFGGETAGRSCGEPSAAYFADPAAFRAWAYAPALPREPYPVGAPTVTGSPAVGGTLHCTAPAWNRARGGNPTTIRYSWATVTTAGPFTIPTPIAGAEGPDLTVEPDLSGTSVACLVTAANGAGTVTALSTAVSVP